MSDSPSILLIDNSNTRTKFALARNGVIGPEIRLLPTKELDTNRVRGLLEDWNFNEAILCSVADTEKRLALRASIPCPLHEVNASSTPELLRLFHEPEKVGSDRIANAAALAALAPLPAIAVDLGTACTFDVVGLHQGTPAFLGGTIAPGMTALSQALCERAAMLPPVQLPSPCPAHLKPNPVARNTQDAMLSGVVNGYQGLVQYILHDISRRMGCPLFVVLTGGDASLVESNEIKIDKVDNLLTMKGMLVLRGKRTNVFL